MGPGPPAGCRDRRHTEARGASPPGRPGNTGAASRSPRVAGRQAPGVWAPPPPSDSGARPGQLQARGRLPPASVPAPGGAARGSRCSRGCGAPGGPGSTHTRLGHRPGASSQAARAAGARDSGRADRGPTGGRVPCVRRSRGLLRDRLSHEWARQKVQGRLCPTRCETVPPSGEAWNIPEGCVTLAALHSQGGPKGRHDDPPSEV